MPGLRIADGLALPIDTVTSTLIIYGGKGMGKTNLGAVIAEEVSSANRRFSVIDPLGVWWGLAFGADGKSPGIPFVALGGPKGDIPITPLSGAVVADFVADEDVSTVITLLHADGRMWTVGERIRFVADFTYRLFERQGERKRPLLLIFDEAGRFVPQHIPAGSVDIARCVGGVEQLVELGRNVAVGVALITQRSARMNKSVSELADAMIAFRTVGPRSIDAIIDWLGEHVPRERQREILEQLRALPVGTALVISPGWLQIEQVVAMRARETYDSSATPDGGSGASPKGRGSKPDLDKYRARMVATIEEAEATDPVKLRRVLQENATKSARAIADLERQLRERPAAAAEPVIEYVDREVPVLNGEVTHLQAVAVTLGQVGREIARVGDDIITAIARVESAPRSAPEQRHTVPVQAGASSLLPARGRSGAPSGEAIPRTRGIEPATSTDPAQQAVVGAPTDGPVSLGKAERSILAALAVYPQGRTMTQVAILTGYASTGGGFKNALGRLRSLAYIEGSKTDIRITDVGLDAAGDVAPLPTGRALLDLWVGRLPKAERLVLEELTGVYPAAMTIEDLAARTGYEPTGGGFKNALGKLRTLELIRGDRSALSASPDLADA